MKKTLLFVAFSVISLIASAQSVNMSGKRFLQTDNIPGDTYIRFESNSKAMFIMTGSGYTDECPCSCAVNGNKISIKCICADKEIYPDPIEDSFTYDASKATLTSTRYRNASNGSYFVWTLK